MRRGRNNVKCEESELPGSRAVQSQNTTLDSRLGLGRHRHLHTPSILHPFMTALPNHTRGIRSLWLAGVTTNTNRGASSSSGCLSQFLSFSHRRCSKHNTRLLSSSSIAASGRSSLSKTYAFGRTNRIDFTTLSARQAAELEDDLLSWFNKYNGHDTRLLDPLLGKAVTRTGLDWIKSISIPSSRSFGNPDSDTDDCKSLVVTLKPPTLLHPQLHLMASNLTEVVQESVASLISNRRESNWDLSKRHDLDPKNIPVEIRIQPQSTRQQSKPNLKTSQTALPSLRNIKHFLAVSSCKGGVGKSTIAVNLAYQLSSMGGRVGLLDLDVYGPSLPLLVRPDDPTVRQSSPEIGEGMIDPIEHRGVKLMSLGYVSPNSGVPGSGSDGGAAVLRGPMAGRVVSQLLKGTNWGELDVLVLDMPPGTGDIQIEVWYDMKNI